MMSQMMPHMTSTAPTTNRIILMISFLVNMVPEFLEGYTIVILPGTALAARQKSPRKQQDTQRKRHVGRQYRRKNGHLRVEQTQRAARSDLFLQQEGVDSGQPAQPGLRPDAREQVDTEVLRGVSRSDEQLFLFHNRVCDRFMVQKNP